MANHFEASLAGTLGLISEVAARTKEMGAWVGTGEQVRGQTGGIGR